MIFSRVYFTLISLAIIGWLYIWGVGFNPLVLIPAIVTLLFYLFQYKAYGRSYVVDLINSNIFLSLFFLSWPCIYIIAVLNSKVLSFYEKLASSYVASTVSIFAFSAIWGSLIAFLPAREKDNTKITIKTRLMFLLKLLGILYILCLFV